MEPITRQEMFLAAASGEEVTLPEPITREEMYLKAIVDNGKKLTDLLAYSNGSNSITYGLDVIYAGVCYVHKVGRIVQFSMGLQLTSDKASESLLVNLPYKPLEKTFFVACNSQTNKSYAVSMSRTSGNITVAYNTSMPAGYYWFSGAYITQE